MCEIHTAIVLLLQYDIQSPAQPSVQWACAAVNLVWEWNALCSQEHSRPSVTESCSEPNHVPQQSATRSNTRSHIHFCDAAEAHCLLMGLKVLSDGTGQQHSAALVQSNSDYCSFRVVHLNKPLILNIKLRYTHEEILKSHVFFYTLKNAGLFQPNFGSNMD